MPNNLILLTGVPGAGKTTTAEYLSTQYGYLHFDREAFAQWPKFQQILWHQSLRLFLSWAETKSNRIVISWGFLPGKDDDVLIQLISMGFVMFWFDGNREVARSNYMKRGATSDTAFKEQIERIDAMDPGKFHAKPVNPFTESGSFVDQESIAQYAMGVRPSIS
jgi:hypothetical protein